MNVFSTFGSIGGSSIGYKRLGFNVIGYNEIDKKFFDFYVKKHNPKYAFNCDIRDLINMELPNDLMNIDILDGSPPCTLFSNSNIKADMYKGKEKKFKEGQTKQILDELVFIYADLINKIKPKIFVFENVSGITHQKNKHYISRFISSIEKDYAYTKLLCNSYDLGLPQSRTRFFIFGIKKEYCKENFMGLFDINIPVLNNKKVFKDIEDKEDIKAKDIPSKLENLYKNTQPGNTFDKTHNKLYGKKSYFNYARLHYNLPVPTLTTASEQIFHPTIFRSINKKEVMRAFGIEEDYFDNSNINFRHIGYSVPPIFYEKLIPEVLKNFTI